MMDKMNFCAALPEILLLAMALVILIADLFIRDEHRNSTFVATILAIAVTAAVCVVDFRGGAVSHAFGGMYVADPMANLLKIVAALCAAVMLVYARRYAQDRDMWKGELFSLTLFVLLGIFVMISAANMLVLYLGLELQSLSLYALVALRRDDARSTEAAMKYFVLGALASGFLLYGISMLYGATGTIDIRELARSIGTGVTPARPALVLGVVFVVAAIGFKLSAAPFHMWAPDVYQGAPTPVTLLISSAPKLAAFAIAVRLLLQGLPALAVDWHKMLILLALTSLAIGNVTAIAQSNLKRMLAYSTIGQIGFMLLAMASGVLGDRSGAANAYGAAMFYAITYVLTTLGTFGVSLLVSRRGFEAEEINDLKGLSKRSPWFAFVMLLLMFSLAGIPPTMGFDAKFVVLQAWLADGLNGPNAWVAIVALAFSLIAAFYYLRVVKVMYFDEPTDLHPIQASQDMRIVLSVNGALVLLIGVQPGYLLSLCASAMAKALGG